MAFLVIIILINLRFLFLGLCFFVWICWWVLLLDFFFLLVLFYGLDYRRSVLDC